MAKREYTGDPIDLTQLPKETHLSEQNGETVAGTTEDDDFEQRTTLVPEDIDEESITEKQWKAIRAFQVDGDKENPSLYSLARDRDFSADAARSAIHKVFRSVRDIEDIPPSYRLAVLISAYEGDSDYAALAEQYPLSKRAFQEAKHVYPDLIREYEGISQDELEKAVAQYEQNKQEKIGNSFSADNPESTTENSSESRSDAKKHQKPREEKDYPEDFTETYEWFIEAISDTPNKSKQEIAETIPANKDFSGQNYYNVVKSYSDVIKQRILEKGTATTESDLCQYLQQYITIDADDDSGVSESDASETESDSTDTNNETQDIDDKYDARLRSVESKVESLRQQVETVEGDGKDAEEVQLAKIIVGAVSDDELGRLIRESFQNNLSRGEE